MILREAEVLVIGAGGAGLRAAIAADDMKAKALIISKSLMGKSGCTPMAEGGYNAAISKEPEDSVESHFEDTMASGGGLSNPDLVRILVAQAPRRLYDLEGFGALFSRGGGGLIAQRKMGAQSFARTCYAGDRTGHEIMMTLLEEVRRRDIEVLNYLLAVDLMTSGGRVCGALTYDIRHADFVLIQSKVTILAAGGGGKCWSVTTNSHQGTGDGYALAARAGALLCDLEQIQFHPTGMVYPDSVKGVLVTEAVRGEGGYLYNVTPQLQEAIDQNIRLKRGGDKPRRLDPEDFGAERFMCRYDPQRLELAKRDIVTRAIAREILEGRCSGSGGVVLSVVHLAPDLVRDRLSTTCKQFQDFASIDITLEPMEVAPTMHHVMGGAVIDEECRTSLKSLYACGEVVGGIHGGNRIGGNALAEGQVFGAIAGQMAAEEARAAGPANGDILRSGDEMARWFASKLGSGGGKSRPCHIKRGLQEVMTTRVGIVRDESGLREAADAIDNLEEEFQQVGVRDGRLPFDQDVIDYLEVRNMLPFSKLVARSALLRRESRGSHYRSDFPDSDEADFSGNIFALGEEVWPEKKWS